MKNVQIPSLFTHFRLLDTTLILSIVEPNLCFFSNLFKTIIWSLSYNSSQVHPI